MLRIIIALTVSFILLVIPFLKMNRSFTLLTAQDDGGGCIQALEVLTLFQRLGIQPKRTIRTVFFMNEEMGLSGAEVYGEWSAVSGEKHIAGIESDRGVHTPRGFF